MLFRARGAPLLSRARWFSSDVVVRNNLRSSLGHTELSKRFPSNALSWYACGPTVYDSAHLGHARTYICTDVIRRMLVHWFRYNIDYAMGLTDIDDKIVTKANALNIFDKSLDASDSKQWHAIYRLTSEITDEFFRDMDDLNVLRPRALLRVSEHVPEIIQYISKIIENGGAYVLPSGVYFDVARHDSEYGKLGAVHVHSAECPHDSVESAGESLLAKRDPKDFALWKTEIISAGHANEVEPVFDSPWGKGRPGWHIECSAMTHAYFGKDVDIHSGGIDLLFPHHTNEVAQWYDVLTLL